MVRKGNYRTVINVTFSKNGIKGTACGEDKKIPTLTELVRCWLLSVRLWQKGHAASVLFCYDLFTRASHRQTQSSYLSHTVSHPCRDQVKHHHTMLTCPEKRGIKTHHVFTFTPVTLELWLNEHMKEKSFQLTFLYAAQHARDKQNKAGLHCKKTVIFWQLGCQKKKVK